MAGFRRGAICMAVVAASVIASAAWAQRTALHTRLRGDDGGGRAFVVGNGGRGGALRVSVRARGAAGRVVTVRMCGQNVGTITLSARGERRGARGTLRLSTRRGDTVPSCSAGDSVRVSGAVSLNGTLQGR